MRSVPGESLAATPQRYGHAACEPSFRNSNARAKTTSADSAVACRVGSWRTGIVTTQ